jgi:hypothetical protein
MRTVEDFAQIAEHVPADWTFTQDLCLMFGKTLKEMGVLMSRLKTYGFVEQRVLRFEIPKTRRSQWRRKT